MVEKRIYSEWAFTENEKEKAKFNYEIYSEYKDNNIFYHQWKGHEADDQSLKSQFVYENAGSGYAHTKYRVISNPNNLSTLQMALICDDGNLCFGYRTESGLIVIHTD